MTIRVTLQNTPNTKRRRDYHINQPSALCLAFDWYINARQISAVSCTSSGPILPELCLVGVTVAINPITAGPCVFARMKRRDHNSSMYVFALFWVITKKRVFIRWTPIFFFFYWNDQKPSFFPNILRGFILIGCSSLENGKKHKQLKEDDNHLLGCNNPLSSALVDMGGA